MRLEHFLENGKNYSGSFRLKNPSDLAVDIHISTGEYRYIRSSGTISPEGPAGTLPSCKDWLQFEKGKLRLNPKETRETGFVIRVPWEASGEHLCAVVLDEKIPLEETRRKEGVGNISLHVTPRFTIPVYIIIKKDAKIAAQIKELSIKPELQKEGIVMSLTLENTGTVHIRPLGTLVILNQDQEVVKNLPIGKTLPIFPGYKETIPIMCRGLPAGKYSAVATIEITKDNIIQKKAVFDYRPPSH